MKKEYENPELTICYFGVNEELTAPSMSTVEEELDNWA